MLDVPVLHDSSRVTLTLGRVLARLYLQSESEHHDECRDGLIAALPENLTTIPLSPIQGGNLSSVMVQGPSDGDVYTAVTTAIRTLPWDFWSAVYSLQMDDEAQEQAHRAAERAWNRLFGRAA